MRNALVLLVTLLPTPIAAAPVGYFDLLPCVTLETGDAWISEGKRYRLYGLQSCLRGTSYTDKHGQKRDCREASPAVLAAYIKDAKSVCAPVVKKDGIAYVVCYATVAKERLDLANVLITSGYALAALTSEGLPITFLMRSPNNLLEINGLAFGSSMTFSTRPFS